MAFKRDWLIITPQMAPCLAMKCWFKKLPVNPPQVRKYSLAKGVWVEFNGGYFMCVIVHTD